MTIPSSLSVILHVLLVFPWFPPVYLCILLISTCQIILGVNMLVCYSYTWIYRIIKYCFLLIYGIHLVIYLVIYLFMHMFVFCKHNPVRTHWVDFSIQRNIDLSCFNYGNVCTLNELGLTNALNILLPYAVRFSLVCKNYYSVLVLY